MDADEYFVRVEINAIILGKPKVGEYILKNKGIKKDDVEITLLEAWRER